jgi:CHAT domain-containing protein/tetratricopeptide (TPR) repeat protein
MLNWLNPWRWWKIFQLHRRWQNLMKEASKLYEQGEIRSAIPIFERALTIAREIFPAPNKDLAASLNNLAGLYKLQGRWADAEPLYDEALNICRKLFGKTANNDLATSLNNLAGLYKLQGRWADAEPLYDEALNICRKLFGKTANNDLATILNNLARFYESQGRLTDAEDLYNEALKIYRKLFGDTVNNYLAASLNNLAQLYESQGRWTDAEDLYDEALKIRRKLFGDAANNDLSTSLNNLAQLYISTDRYPAALQLFTEAIEVQNRVLANYFAHTTPENQLILLESLHPSLELFTTFVVKYQSENPIAVATLFDAILQRKAASTIASTILNRTQYTNRYPHLRDTFDRWDRLKTQLSHTGDDVTRRQLETQCKQLQQQLSRQVPEIKAESLDINRQTIALYLPPLTQLVEFFRFRDVNFHKSAPENSTWQPARYIAFVVSADLDLPVRLIDLGLAEPIDLAIEKYRSVVSKRDETMGMNDRKKQPPTPSIEPTIAAEIIAGCTLRAAIIDPILQHIPHAETIIFAADSELYRVPFATLPLDESGTRIIDKYRVETLTAARDLRRRYQEIDRTMSALPTAVAGAPILVGDPDYDYGSAEMLPTIAHPEKHLEPTMGGNFRRMEITQKLIRSIAKKLDVTPYLDTQATSSIFQQQSPEILIVATHGFAFPNTYHRQQQDAWKELYSSSRADDEKVIAKYVNAIDLGFRAQLQQRLDNNPNSDNANWYRALLPKIDNHLAKYPPSRDITKEPNPMLRCGIALTGANHWLQNHPLAPEVGNGVLLAHDIAQLNLWGTQLAVLVACSTALGDSKAGQGIFGLRRGFALSGAKHTIVSLWDVPVNASILLMERFFDLYKAGIPPAEALHRAQNYIRNISIAELRTTSIGEAGIEGLEAIDAIDLHTSAETQPWQSPYYWGAWICQG